MKRRWPAAVEHRQSLLHIERRQERDREPARLGGGEAAKPHLGRIGIGAAVGLVMEVVKLPDGGIAGLRHLDIGLGGNGLKFIRIHLQRKAVHGVAPGPEEAIVGARALGQAGDRPLMGMAVDVGHTRQCQATDPLGTLPVIDRHSGDPAIVTDRDGHARLHPFREKSLETCSLRGSWHRLCCIDSF